LGGIYYYIKGDSLMIKLTDSDTLGFIAFLSIKYPTPNDVYLTVLHGCDCTEAEDGTKGFAVYSPKFTNQIGKDIIMLPGEYPDEGDIFDRTTVLESLAHEYCHHMQNCEGVLIEENSNKIERDAEKFAKKAVFEYLNEDNKKSFVSQYLDNVLATW